MSIRLSRKSHDRTLLGFLRDRCGSAAVEFSILAGPLIAMIFATWEVCWYYFANAQVDGAILDSSRLIRTGSLQNLAVANNKTAKEFFEETICSRVEMFGECDDRLTVEVDTYADFSTIPVNDPVVCANDAPQLVQNLRFSPGTENSIVRVRICYLYSSLNPAVGVNLVDESGKRRLTNSFIFKSEPYLRNQQGTTP